MFRPLFNFPDSVDGHVIRGVALQIFALSVAIVVTRETAVGRWLAAAVLIDFVLRLLAGAPARLDGVPQIIEGFRFPAEFDQDSIPVFNTNTFVMDAAAIDRDFALPFYKVEKKVEGATAIQFERLVGELTALVPSAFVEVPRSGADSRFIAVKDPGDLEKQKEIIGRVTRSHRSLRDLREDEIF